MCSIEVIKYTNGTFHVNRLYPPEIDQSVELAEVKLEELSDHLEFLLAQVETTREAIVKLPENTRHTG